MKNRLVAALVLFAGCDVFNNTSARVQAPHVLVATVLATPQITIKAEAIAGFPFFDGGIPMFDGGIPSFDGGFPFDAGGFTFDAGGFLFGFDGGSLTIPAQTALIAFFGQRMGTDLNVAPTGVDDAQLFAGTPTKAWALKALGGGAFQLTSVDDNTLQYTSGVTWTFSADAGTAVFSGSVDDAPGSENIAQLHPDSGYIALAAGSGYQLTRPDPPEGEDRNLGFVTVFPIDLQGQQGTATYTNVPSTPLKFLKLVAAPSEWKQTLVDIPDAAFPEPNKNYVILMQTAKLGTNGTTNLFLGSPIIAGAADVGVVKTH